MLRYLVITDIKCQSDEIPSHNYGIKGQKHEMASNNCEIKCQN